MKKCKVSTETMDWRPLQAVAVAKVLLSSRALT